MEKYGQQQLSYSRFARTNLGSGPRGPDNKPRGEKSGLGTLLPECFQREGGEFI